MAAVGNGRGVTDTVAVENVQFSWEKKKENKISEYVMTMSKSTSIVSFSLTILIVDGDCLAAWGFTCVSPHRFVEIAFRADIRSSLPAHLNDIYVNQSASEDGICSSII